MKNRDFYKVFREYNIQHYCRATHAPRNSLVKCHFVPLFGDKEVREVTPSDINTAFDVMEQENLAQNTIFGAHAAFTSYFRIAIRLGETESNPVKSARVIRYRPDGI